MKLRFVKSLLVTFGFVAAVGFAQAQSMNANVPFDFYVGEKKLPAGNYRLHMLSDRALALSQESGNAGLTLVIPKVRGANTTEPKLVFQKISGEYFLSQVFNSYGSNGLELTPTHT